MERHSVGLYEADPPALVRRDLPPPDDLPPLDHAPPNDDPFGYEETAGE